MGDSYIYSLRLAMALLKSTFTLVALKIIV